MIRTIEDLKEKGVEENVIYNADCIEALKHFKDNSIDLVLTDPPYNISQKKNVKRINVRNPAMRRVGKRSKTVKFNFGKWDFFETKEEYLDFNRKWTKLCYDKLKPNGSLYCFFSRNLINYLEDILEESGFKVRSTCVWHKTNPMPRLFTKGFVSSCEFFTFATKSSKYFFNTNYVKHNLFEGGICQGNERTEHRTQKPEWLIKELIEISSNKNDIILDPFMGSGTTAVACKKLNRRYIGIEINENYCDIARERLNKVPKRLDNFFNAKAK